MKKLKLMADYGCWPLWEDSSDTFGNVDPATLPISAELLAKLYAWEAEFDSLLDKSDPGNSRFESKEHELAFKLAFNQTGMALELDLTRELGPEYEVWFKKLRLS